MFRFREVSFLLLCAASLSLVNSKPHYAERIPNGLSVPNPDIPTSTWAGVGHLKTGGGGELNPFGLDFAAAGHEWTVDLCQTDSDDDGRSNGEELGDPNCVWVAGGPDPEGPALSHPGLVDEPLVPDETTSVHSCTNYEEPENIEVFDIVFDTPNEVDETQTHYICQQQRINIEIPQQPYHLIKTSVILDNPNLLHHMFVYVCPPDVVPSDGDRSDEGSYYCAGTGETNCRTVGGWAVGPHDACQPPNVGLEFDLTGIDSALIKIEAHYDNAIGVPQQDQSGMKFFVTPDLRPLKSGSLTLGMTNVDNDFVIPALTPTTTLSNVCPSEATRLLPHPVYVYDYYPHMHLFGYQLYTEHWRCGKKIGEIGRIDSYEFDNQQAYPFHLPVKVLPGDSLVTKCMYDTSGHNDTVFGGEETSNEMCLNFLGYYPNAQTPENPDLLAACISILNGIESPNPALDNIRVAVTGSEESFLLDFDDDPSNSWAECCDAGNCEEIYMASTGEACAQDTDCEGALICNGGLCEGETTEEEDVLTAGEEPAEIVDGDDPSAAAHYRLWMSLTTGMIAGLVSFFLN